MTQTKKDPSFKNFVKWYESQQELDEIAKRTNPKHEPRAWVRNEANEEVKEKALEFAKEVAGYRGDEEAFKNDSNRVAKAFNDYRTFMGDQYSWEFRPENIGNAVEEIDNKTLESLVDTEFRKQNDPFLLKHIAGKDANVFLAYGQVKHYENVVRAAENGDFSQIPEKERKELFEHVVIAHGDERGRETKAKYAEGQIGDDVLKGVNSIAQLEIMQTGVNSKEVQAHFAEAAKSSLADAKNRYKEAITKNEERDIYVISRDSLKKLATKDGFGVFAERVYGAYLDSRE